MAGSMTHFDPVFLSHGSPMLALDPGETGRAWARLAQSWPRPDAVLAVSAHWMTEAPAVSGADNPETIYDFYGFPEPLYRLVYRSPGAPALAERVANLLAAAGIPHGVDPERGLDHGAWVALKVLYPEGIPVASFSVQPRRDARWHVEVGRALAPLTDEGVLVLATGGAVHNLREMDMSERTPSWARAFDEWLADALAAGREDELLDWTRAPEARRAHPSPEHLYPLFVAYGAAGVGAKGERIHSGFTLGSMSMAAYRFAA
jgi:4,5-DOPA dioxygenase extradiol